MSCSALLKNNTQCKNAAKHFMEDGKAYCGRHIPTLWSKKNDEYDKKDENAKRLLLSVVSIFLGISRKMMNLFIMLVVMFVFHFFAKAYYFNNCDSNLIKAWFFKKSHTCVTIANILTMIETWSFDSLSTITKYFATTLFST